MMSLTRLFCDTDDFCQWFIAEWEKAQIEEGSKKRRSRVGWVPSFWQPNTTTHHYDYNCYLFIVFVGLQKAATQPTHARYHYYHIITF